MSCIRRFHELKEPFAREFQEAAHESARGDYEAAYSRLHDVACAAADTLAIALVAIELTVAPKAGVDPGEAVKVVREQMETTLAAARKLSA